MRARRGRRRALRGRALERAALGRGHARGHGRIAGAALEREHGTGVERPEHDRLIGDGLHGSLAFGNLGLLRLVLHDPTLTAMGRPVEVFSYAAPAPRDDHGRMHHTSACIAIATQ